MMSPCPARTTQVAGDDNPKFPTAAETCFARRTADDPVVQGSVPCGRLVAVGYAQQTAQIYLTQAGLAIWVVGVLGPLFFVVRQFSGSDSPSSPTPKDPNLGSGFHHPKILVATSQQPFSALPISSVAESLSPSLLEAVIISLFLVHLVSVEWRQFFRVIGFVSETLKLPLLSTCSSDLRRETTAIIISDFFRSTRSNLVDFL